MTTVKASILQIPESVREETLKYRSQVEKFVRGESSPLVFRAYRVPMGVYEQRTPGKFMVRIRIGAGLVVPLQLDTIARLSKQYGNGILHVTTRQDIQIHNVSIEDTADVLEALLEVGLSPRGGGGNTVRNITACPEAGVCPKEEFDVSPYAIATAEYLLRDKSSFNLPRKYKIVFAGCSQDCAYASVADLGFFAHRKNAVKGFAVYAGGGLGANPAVGVKIEDFAQADDVFEIAEAVKRLFDKHWDRSNKHKARLRYVLARLGREKFEALYQKERDTLNADGLPYKPPPIRDIMRNYPAPRESVSVRLRLEKGDIPADDLIKVGQIAARYGQGLVRTTQMQDLLITGVAAENVNTVNNELKNLTISVLANGEPKIVACAGAATCRLGLCLSRDLSEAISSRLGRADLSDRVIRISGCPNSCGHHYIADIGFQGRAKRVNGRLMPFYDVLVGAKIAEGDTHLAERIGTVPAKRIPDLLAHAQRNANFEKELLTTLALQYSNIAEEPLPDDYYFDWGSDKPFSLAGRGPGECGAGVMDVIRLDIDQAKDAIKTVPVSDENIYKAVVAAARALLVTFGLEPKKDREIFAAFSKHIIEPGWVGAQAQQLLDTALDWRMGDVDSISDLATHVRDLVSRIEELFLSLDANLKFRAAPVSKNEEPQPDKTENNVIDLRGVACPLNFVKAKLELEKLEIGDILEVLLDAGEPAQNAPASFAEQGQEVLQVKNVGDYYLVKVRRKK